MLTDKDGNVVWQNDFTPFGEETGESGYLERTGMYTSKKIDPDTGLYYFNARWYDASLGKFITEDPIKDGVNWYVYCANNPLRYIDPTGLNFQTYQEIALQAPIIIQAGFDLTKDAFNDPVAVTATTTVAAKVAQKTSFLSKISKILKSGSVLLAAEILKSPYTPLVPLSDGKFVSSNDMPAGYEIVPIVNLPLFHINKIQFPDGSLNDPNDIVIDENGNPVLIGDPNAVSPLSTASQDDAFNDALKDALIVPGTEPYRIDTWVPLTERNRTTPVLDDDGNILYTENSYYINEDGKKIVIQHHPDGHPNYNTTTPHYNIRDVDKEGKPIRNSKPEGSKEHYNYKKEENL